MYVQTQMPTAELISLYEAHVTNVLRKQAIVASIVQLRRNCVETFFIALKNIFYYQCNLLYPFVIAISVKAT